MVKRRTFKRISLPIDVFACFLTLVSAATLFIFMFSPSWVDDLDNYLIEKYKVHYENRFLGAEEMLKNKPQQGLELFQDMANDFKLIQKGDRLAQLKRVVLFRLFSTYQERNNYKEALHWVNEWIDFDDKDLNAKVRKAMLMLSSPEHSPGGRKYLNELYTLFPDVKSIRQLYFRFRT